ncbi:malto-oligosyltrehalose trehalohydrolase [Chitinophagaceae bacterium LB-8]|uniref:Malto-oligosyltrehalose trehalohydrolase n=1 Tax=Paraflavisolibacter caeni TaxID=2982496 RepID=A0A9X2XW14_9BACT|nr:malto-oligosyltrehalose trehalohydrolase [Paraflavisolibacter caeni]MCU7549672.1 malto-oligosyltrehalose trehalohydrolase [Paraflavisolibacter caeni]
MRKPGVDFHKNGTNEIVLWAPYAVKVETIIDGAERLELEKSEEGYWKLTTDQIKEGSRYQFCLNGSDPLPDPASRFQPEGVHGSSQAIDLKNYQWSDEQWKNPPLEEYILYELHTGTFTQEGTFLSIEQKLDYLKDLGVNAIEIMPVAQFPGSRNWGYDGVAPYAVQNSYGGPRGLQHLVNACHHKGIAVVLDVVYNHLGPEGAYHYLFGPYFNDKYRIPWGGAINFDDAWSDGVRDYFIENALMWFREFHIDALRLDAVHAIKDFSPVHILKEIKLRVNDLMKETGRTHYLMVELDLNDTRYIDQLEKGGYGMDAQWVDEFHHSLRVTAGGSRYGYFSDFEGIHHLAKAYQDVFVYDGQFSQHRKKRFGVKVEGENGGRFIVFSQNHDQVGNRMLGERTSVLKSFEMQKVLAGSVLFSPYIPMLFMGEEWSEPHPFLYFVSHTDPQLAEAVRKGRKAEFTAFHAEGEAPDPMDQDAFLQSKLQWDLLEEEPHRTMFRFYQTLIAVRKQQPALSHLNRSQLDVEVMDEQNVLFLRRWHHERQVFCYFNFSGAQQTVKIPNQSDKWHLLINSAAPEWNGHSAVPTSVSHNENIDLQPESFILYSNNHV